MAKTTKPHFRIASGGSFQNRLAEISKSAEPKVGDGATVLYYSDRHAGTIESVETNRKGVVIAAVVREDKATRTDTNGMSECQTYKFEPNPEGRTWTFTKRRTGQWVQKGDAARNGLCCQFGHRNAYHDYSF